MTDKELIDIMNSGATVKGGSEAHIKMGKLNQAALQITSVMNGRYCTPDELRELMQELTGGNIGEALGLIPPFHTDCGKNIHIGDHVFINAGCKFQDQGGIFIGDGALIGHGVVIATLDHGLLPENRQDLIPRPVNIGKNVWIGSNSTILSGVTIGDNAVIGAGSVVTKDIPENMIAVGNPARVIRNIFEEG